MPKPGDGRTKGRKVIPGEQYLSLREGSKDWQIGFSIERHRVRESSGTPDKAAAAALALKRYDEVWREIKLGEAPKREITVNDAFVRFWDEVAQHTSYGRGGQRYQMHVLLPLLGRETLLSRLDNARINDLVQALRTRAPEPGSGRTATLSPATINRYLATLSVVCKRARTMWGVEVGAWTPATHKLTEAKHREVFLDHDQARSLIEHAVGHLKPILMLAFCTGMRAANVVGLTWESVSLDMRRAVVIQKGDRRLAVDLPDLAVRTLAAVQPDPSQRVGAIFRLGNPAVPCSCEHCRSPRSAGAPIRSVKRSFATAARAAGLRDMEAGRLRFHDLRHTFASWMLAETGDLLLVRDALGHANVATTQRYAHLLPGRKARAVEGAVSGLLEPPATERKKA